jgi:hypothetical protein
MEPSLCPYHRDQISDQGLAWYSSLSALACSFWLESWERPPVLCVLCIEKALWDNYELLSESQKNLLTIPNSRAPDPSTNTPPPAYDTCCVYGCDDCQEIPPIRLGSDFFVDDEGECWHSKREYDEYLAREASWEEGSADGWEDGYCGPDDHSWDDQRYQA